MQQQFSRTKQMVHPAVSNSDTLVYVSVTVYPNHIDQPDQGTSNFLGEIT